MSRRRKRQSNSNRNSSNHHSSSGRTPMVLFLLFGLLFLPQQLLLIVGVVGRVTTTGTTTTNPYHHQYQYHHHHHREKKTIHRQQRQAQPQRQRQDGEANDRTRMNSNSNEDSNTNSFSFDVDWGGIPWDDSVSARRHNTRLLSERLASIANDNVDNDDDNHHPTTKLIVDKTFHLYNGVRVQNLQHFTLELQQPQRQQQNQNDNDNVDDDNDNDGAWVPLLQFHRYHPTADNDNGIDDQDDLDDEEEKDVAFLQESLVGTVFENPYGHPPACWSFVNCYNITLMTTTTTITGTTTNTTTTTATTSTNPQAQPQPQIQALERGLINGGGPEWWGIPLVGYLQLHEQRPYLFLMNGTQYIQIHHVTLQDAPFYTLQLTNVQHVHIYNMSIVNRRRATSSATSSATPSHDIYDLSAFNTDGIDIAGHNVHVHDVDIWTQDDCIAVKDNTWDSSSSSRDNPVEEKSSSNMLFERITASGLGLTIGSIAGTTVRNITFRDCYLSHTVKGIYLKFRSLQHHHQDHDHDSSTYNLPHEQYNYGLIEHVRYENIYMNEPTQWPIWIGPAQQTGGTSSNLCHASPCSLCWPVVVGQSCAAVPGNATYRNILLSNVTIRNPHGSPGVILGGNGGDDGEEDNNHAVTAAAPPIYNLTFHNVRVVLDKNKDDDVMTTTTQADFPVLSYPVHDPWAYWTQVTLNLIGLLLILIVMGVLCCQLRQRCQANRRGRPIVLLSEEAEEVSTSSSSSLQESCRTHYSPVTTIPVSTTSTISNHPAGRSSRRRSNFRTYCCTVLTFLGSTFLMAFLTVQLVYSIWLLPQLDTPLQYFVCQGVQGGVATGRTFPVPSCLDDQTDPDKDKDSDNDTLPYFSSLYIVGKQVLLGLLLLLGWVWYIRFLKRCCCSSSCCRWNGNTVGGDDFKEQELVAVQDHSLLFQVGHDNDDDDHDDDDEGVHPIASSSRTSYRDHIQGDAVEDDEEETMETFHDEHETERSSINPHP